MFVSVWCQKRSSIRFSRLLVAAGLVLWAILSWTLMGVQLLFDLTGACFPPGVSVRIIGDGVDRVDCGLPPR